MKSSRYIRSLLEESILRTLLYADIFHFPLTKEEAWKYLISPIPYTKKAVFDALKKLGGLLTRQGYVGVSNKAMATQRNAAVLEQKIQEAKRASKVFGWLPTIQCICITGGTAVGNVTHDDDIDLMIITREGWLWTTRLIVVLVSKILGKYRSRLFSEHHSPQVRDRWCFNLWLDMTALAVPLERQNMYTAHEVVQTFHMLNKNNTHEHFLSANSWTRSYLPHSTRYTKTFAQEQQKKSIHLIERIAFAVQQRYMKEHQTREIATAHAAFFHPRTTAAQIQHAFEKRLQKYFVVPYPAYNQDVTVSRVYTSRKMQTLIQKIWRLKKLGKCIVYASGVFDLFHSEHKKYLQKSKKIGDVLVVGVESDMRVKEMKGKERPMQSEHVRIKQVASLPYIDEAMLLPRDFSSQTRREELLFFLRPDIYTGSSHSMFQKQKTAIMKHFYGVFCVVHAHNPNISTTRGILIPSSHI